MIRNTKRTEYNNNTPEKTVKHHVTSYGSEMLISSHPDKIATSGFNSQS